MPRITGFGKDLQARLQRFFEAPLDAQAAPLEIVQAALDDVERHVQPLGRGRRGFPYNRLTIHVRETSAGSAAIEAAFADIEQRIRERLSEVQCEAPQSLAVKTAVMADAPEEWPEGRVLAIDYERVAGSATAAPLRRVTAAPVVPAETPVRPCIELVVLKGAATDERFTFSDASISIGRTAEPTDGMGRLRRNRVVFLDSVDGVTETVGRAHARLRYDQMAGGYLLFDDGSANGTSIVRDGTSIPVLPRDPRGVRVQSGDEIQIGRAVLRVS